MREGTPFQFQKARIAYAFHLMQQTHARQFQNFQFAFAGRIGAAL